MTTLFGRGHVACPNKPTTLHNIDLATSIDESGLADAKGLKSCAALLKTPRS